VVSILKKPARKQIRNAALKVSVTSAVRGAFRLCETAQSTAKLIR
jgi:hypothetical protein